MSASRTRFDISLSSDIDRIAARFKRAGAKLYLVGGAVRDALMRLPHDDIDLATNLHPTDVIELLHDIDGFSISAVGKSFGVVKLVGSNAEYDIATFRIDHGEGRRPEHVTFTSIDEDVKRRDLTINALFYDLATNEVVDLVGGLADLRNHVVRTVGVPVDRFREDRLRVMRALRFAARFGFSIDPATASAIEADNDLSELAAERIHDEFVKGVTGSSSSRCYLSLLERFKMWSQVFPGLDVRLVPDTHAPSAGPESSNVPVVLSVILNDSRKKISQVLHDLKYTVDEIDRTCFFKGLAGLDATNAAFELKRCQNRLRVTDEELFDAQGNRGLPSFPMLMSFASYELTVKGQDLVGEGFVGKEIGLELARRESLLFKQLHGRATQR